MTEVGKNSNSLDYSFQDQYTNEGQRGSNVAYVGDTLHGWFLVLVNLDKVQKLWDSREIEIGKFNELYESN